ncbi:MAG: hypothetical protein ABEH65_09010 [Halobacteriales archaeon]
MADDDLEEYLDPELDPTSQQTSDLPGPVTLPRVVVGLHLVTAAILVPFAWQAYQVNDMGQVASLGLLIGLLVVAGVVAGRIAERRFGA